MKTTPKHFPLINEHAAAIDIGSEEVYVAVEAEPVRHFSTFTQSLQQMVEYLLEHNVSSVVMEATGVLWMPIYDMIELAGMTPYLINGAHAKNVPGRKSDVQDCQWHLQLHRYGLLRRCFVPEEQIRQLRTYVRLRQDHISMAAQHVQHMHKALDAMNLKLHMALSQINGKSGIAIIKAILSGQRDVEKLLELSDRQIQRNKAEEVRQALQGNYRHDYLFALQQAVSLWEFYNEQIRQCDAEIQKVLKQMTDELPPPDSPSKPKPIGHHKPEIDDLHQMLLKLCQGNDVTQLSGLNDLSVMTLLSELGTDMTRWATEKHFTSWLGLAPRKDSSGKRKRMIRMKTNNRAAQIFRQSAQSLGQSKHLALGGFYRRIKAKAGASVANVATARKLAELYYRTFRYGLTFVEQGLEQYQKRYEQQILKSLTKRAKDFGFDLVPLPT